MDLLKRFRVTALADVRSKPYSAYRPEFNHKNLKKILPEQGIDHIFLGREKRINRELYNLPNQL